MNKTILFAFAHPDDETFACAGTIARYHKDARCIVYCATRGEAGKTGEPPLCTTQELAGVRANELQQACDVLGVSSLSLRQFPDGSLDRYETPLYKDLLHTLQEVQPQIVITFPPHGISGHPDHQTIQRNTLKAVQQLPNNTRPRLLYITIPTSIQRERALPIYSTPDDQINITIDVRPYRTTIIEALRQHRTQHLSVERVFPTALSGNVHSIRATEYYQEVEVGSLQPPLPRHHFFTYEK
ncbi:PIG-L deacetylase family protein [Mechercharimyces sp. CAU 1602]|uniref:PIG-L deacetylase family protein n=1 Tax=Mechercharimyces sp. CAU 1602 TaxID=2973933 RepID=UPI002162AD6A|nr:PIG-L deacetylase family protein [Mechercharimyces sp. CAU 1602]MCS1350957.1 PIG-L family deacetylase [Mechercharimyces sp. CAU 1602]